MQTHDPRQHYTSSIASLTTLLVRRRRYGRLLLTAEIAAFVLAVAFVAAYALTAWGAAALVAAAVCAAGYVAARLADERNDSLAARLHALREVCLRETRYLDGSFDSFDDGRRYAAPRHPFTSDIDVFGPQSLYHRLCRAVTTGGADRLAAVLASPLDGSPDERADAVDELAPLSYWRRAFCAEGVEGKLDSGAVARALHAVASVKVGRWVLSPWAVAAACCALAGFYAAAVAAAVGAVPQGVAVVAAVVLLAAVLALCHSTLMAASRVVGRMQGEVGVLLRLASSIAALAPRCALLRSLCADVAAALPSFREADGIVRALDRRGNILGLIFSDIFVLSDFFLLRRFARWQRTFAATADACLAAVERADALVSMATYRYNEPQMVRAQIADGGADGVVYEARALRHPFLGARAVGNDFSLADRHYYIITGANMAGKSTFLRAVGLNWLLAMCGLPVAADSLRLSRFPLFTSMRTTDDVTRGISYFNAELLRLSQLIAFCADHPHTLVILDEILKGTNSADKLNGSRMFLEHMAKGDVTAIVATHDLELSRMADAMPSRFSNWCFEIALGSRVTYSYRITPGVARNQNATFLLRELLLSEKGRVKNEE